MALDHLVPGLQRHVVNHRGAHDASAVDQAVDLAEARDGMLDRGRDEVRVGDVAGIRLHVVRLLRGEGFDGLAVQVHHADLGAQLQRQFRGGAAHALRGAGDNDDFSSQGHDVGHVLSPRFYDSGCRSFDAAIGFSSP
ncbi:hypothetical protein D3C72_1938270 [compost metagenome]